MHMLDCTKIHAYVRSDKISKEMRKSLKDGGIDITTVPSHTAVTKANRKYVDMMLTTTIYDNLRSSPKTNVSFILLISDDEKLHYVAKDVSDNGYTLILAHSPQADKKLKEAVKHSLDWDTLAMGRFVTRRHEREKPKKVAN